MSDDLDADYRAAGFSGRLGWGERPALVVVDVCMAYLDRVTRPLYAGVEDAVASAARLVDAARSGGVPVVFTRVEYEPGGARRRAVLRQGARRWPRSTGATRWPTGRRRRGPGTARWW